MHRLKPCPFCGNVPMLNKDRLWSGSRGYYGCYQFNIQCEVCGCRINLPCNDSIYRDEETAKQNAISVWNKRYDEE